MSGRSAGAGPGRSRPRVAGRGAGGADLGGADSCRSPSSVGHRCGAVSRCKPDGGGLSMSASCAPVDDLAAMACRVQLPPSRVLARACATPTTMSTTPRSVAQNRTACLRLVTDSTPRSRGSLRGRQPLDGAFGHLRGQLDQVRRRVARAAGMPTPPAGTAGRRPSARTPIMSSTRRSSWPALMRLSWTEGRPLGGRICSPRSVGGPCAGRGRRHGTGMGTADRRQRIGRAGRVRTRSCRVRCPGRDLHPVGVRTMRISLRCRAMECSGPRRLLNHRRVPRCGRRLARSRPSRPLAGRRCSPSSWASPAASSSSRCPLLVAAAATCARTCPSCGGTSLGRSFGRGKAGHREHSFIGGCPGLGSGRAWVG